MRELRDRIVREVRKVVVGQDHVIDVLLSATAVGGHVLLEGPPGVAKTLLANAYARALGVQFRRVQFTPDMLPADVTGTMALRPGPDGTLGELAFRPGPIFANVLLADEINRTPPKTQAALLEAMQEQQVTVDGTSHPLPEPFVVIATQNPIEHEGTYSLPEAQLDRFLAKLDVGYPSAADEADLLRIRHRGVIASTIDDVAPVTSTAELRDLRALVDATVVSDEVVGYAVSLLGATRSHPAIALGGSPRAGVHLLAAARTHARLDQRDFVVPDDVRAVAVPVLRHRIILQPEAELQRLRVDDLLGQIIGAVAVPR